MLKMARVFSSVKILCKMSNYTHINCNFCSKTDINSGLKHFKDKIVSGPSLKHFIEKQSACVEEFKIDAYPETLETIRAPYLSQNASESLNRRVYIETYGCQMNSNDTEIINSILEKEGFNISKDVLNTDVIFVMTCAIREGAEQKIWKRLEYFKMLKKKRRKSQHPLKIGVLGCMAERLKHKLLDREKMVDIVAGPDSYRDLPNLLSLANEGQKAVNVMLSVDETYADVMPVRINPESKSAFVSIMRGCDNMCTYCIVPFTRGKERSRSISSILDEIKHLSDQGYKEVTLLGQNVNSYRDLSESSRIILGNLGSKDILSEGFRTVYKNRFGGLRFADLLERVADVNPEMRIRFTSPHPKDFPDQVLQVINEKPNICNLLHLPAQSGNSEVLECMRRGYTREAYIELIDHIRKIIPGIAFTSDFICGFCGETEEAHQETMSLIERVKYEFAYVFPYSLRDKTMAYHRLNDDVPEEVKKQRASEVADLFRVYALELHQKEVGKEHLVLVEGPSKRSKDEWFGRNDWNTKVIFPHINIPASTGSAELCQPVPGNYVVVKIKDCTSQVLKGEALYHTTLQEFYSMNQNKSDCSISFNYGA